MQFINGREFEKENRDAFETRRKSFIENFKLIFGLQSVGNLTLIAYNSFPLFKQDWAFQGPVYFGVDYDAYPWAFYLFYVFVLYASWISSLLSPNGCLFWSSLIGFLSNEYKILGASYKNIFEDDQTIVETEEKLRRNVVYHTRLNQLNMNKIISK